MSPTQSEIGPQWQRTAIGLIAIGAMLFGGVRFALSVGDQGISGILIRVGLVMGAIWLAMPSLKRFTRVQSLGVFIVFVTVLAFIASRPNLGRVVIALVVIGTATNWGLKWMSRLFSNDLQ